MYDNHRKHKSNKAIEFLKRKSIDWSPYSPDLNQIDKVRRLIARNIMPKDIIAQSDLIEAVKSAWNEIDQEEIENYIDSIPGRINDCISINRYKINY